MQTLTASTGTWAGTEPISYGYRWERCNPGCEDIAAATGPTLLLGPSEVGSTIRVEVTADNTVLAGGGTATARSAESPVIQASDRNAPAITCGAADGAWHAANVSIACTAVDAGSGLADAADAAFTLSTSVPAGTENGNASTGTRQVCDAAGNCATGGAIAGNKVDRKAPALSLPSGKTVDATSPAGTASRSRDGLRRRRPGSDRALHTRPRDRSSQPARRRSRARRPTTSATRPPARSRSPFAAPRSSSRASSRT